MQAAPESTSLFSTLPDVMKVERAAEAFDMPAQTMRALLRCGQIRGFKVGKHWRITKTALLEFVGEVNG